MTKSTALPAEPVIHIQQDIEIKAPIEVVFESMLEQMGPGNDAPGGGVMPMTLEAWPGGRWYRDLGNNAGHFWGHVQVIKPPTILEITGPLFMSYAAISHVQYRLKAEGLVTHLSLTHRAMGEIAPEHRTNVGRGWEHMLERIRARSQK